MICKYCKNETGFAGRAYANHVGWCLFSPKREERIAALAKAREIRKNKPAANQYISAKKKIAK